jgi:tetratricopeptide (TPR) repeat protein
MSYVPVPGGSWSSRSGRSGSGGVPLLGAPARMPLRPHSLLIRISTRIACTLPSGHPGASGMKYGSIGGAVAAVLAFFLLGAGQASAQRVYVDACINESNPKFEIQACTRVIEFFGAETAQISWAFYHRGNAYVAQQDYDRAILDYDAAIKLKPDHAHAYADRGLAYFGKGAFARAIEDYDQAIRLDPSYATTYQDRCYSLAILGHVERALPDCNKALMLSPRDPIFLDSRGYAYLRQGELDKAIADYKAALKSHPFFDTALFGRALAYAAKGDRVQAAHDLKAARSINPKIDQEMKKVRLTAPAGL